MLGVRGRGGRGWVSVVAVALGIGLLTVSSTLIVVPWMSGKLGEADNVSSVVAGLLACAGTAVALMGWLLSRRQLASLPPGIEEVEYAAVSLAGAVYQQWVDEARIRALGDPGP